jgi:hypothetical protein
MPRAGARGSSLLPWRGGFAKERRFPSAQKEHSRRLAAGESAASGNSGTSDYAVLNHPAIWEEKGGEEFVKEMTTSSSIKFDDRGFNRDLKGEVYEVDAIHLCDGLLLFCLDCLRPRAL